MAKPDVSSVIEQLAKTTVEDGSTEVDFSGRGLKLDTENDAKEITDEIIKCKKLLTLRLEGNTLGVEAAKAIAKTLESHPELQKALWKDMFTGRLKSEIPEALRYLSSGLTLAQARLVELDLSDNAFGPIGVEGIKVLLESETCYKLQELRLNNNGLGITGGKMLAKALLGCHRNSSASGSPLSLRVFVCGRNRLENDGAIALAKFFKTVGTLQEVVMPQNGIYHEGVSALAEALACNKNLNVLNLNDNTFTEIGAAAVAKALPELPNLEVLNFGDCLVRSKGAKALASALKLGHHNLRELHLGFNEIDKSGALALAECVKDMPSLDRLDLDGNRLGKEGCSLLRAEMEDAEKESALGPLSEDEGDDEDEEEEEENEDDEEEEDNSAEEIIQPEPTKMKNGFVQHSETSPIETTVDEFLISPSPAKLLGLGDERATLISEKIGNNASFEDTFEVFVKIASCVGITDGKVKEAACECIDAILPRIFKNAEENDLLANISNVLLVQLGLIKSEDKNFKPASELMGPLIVLEHVVKQPYFPRVTKEILQLFLSRPNKAIEACGNAKHKLMQSLYRF